LGPKNCPVPLQHIRTGKTHAVRSMAQSLLTESAMEDKGTGSSVGRRRRARGSGRSCSRRHPSTCTPLLLTALLAGVLAARVSGFSTTIGGTPRVGCQQQRWEGGGRRYHHVSAARRSSSVRKARARMVATEGSRVSMSPEKPSSSSSSSLPQAAAALVSKAGEEQAAAAAAAGTAESARAHRLRVATFFFFWYTFNVGYNLCTKFT
ncbi:unnamed protein product, partial [Ectocarpus fasciculatus]